MKNILTVLVILILPLVTLALSSDLALKCVMLDGQIVTRWTCPHNGEFRDYEHCLIYDNESNPMFFNGCSGSFGNYGEVFFRACLYHDLCYHHEPISNGYTKKDCDSKFLLDMLDICKYEHPKDTKCESSAKWFYRAVDYFGGSSWQCSKEPANYPHNHI